MARYIDADALTEKIKNHAKNVKSGSRYSDDIYELAHEHIVELVGMQPTAYDPDAVVEQLEEESDYEPIDYDYCDVACTDEQHFIATDKAIEIVRRGGAE